jgi:flagellar basal body-associated protein FliL
MDTGMVCEALFCVNNIVEINFKTMAEIHVESQKHQSTPAWIWILVTLVIVALAAYFLTRNTTSTTDQNTGVNNSGATSYVQPPFETGNFYLV